MPSTVRRALVALATITVTGAAMAAPAGAHVLVVDPPGGEQKVAYVGAGPLPGKGQGLVPGGPTGSFLQSPSHAKGLNTACEALRASGNAAADIWGPPTPAGCPHGT